LFARVSNNNNDFELKTAYKLTIQM